MQFDEANWFLELPKLSGRQMQILFWSKRVRFDKSGSWFWMIHVWIFHVSNTLTYMYIPEQQTNYNFFGGNVLGIEVETIPIN